MTLQGGQHSLDAGDLPECHRRLRIGLPQPCGVQPEAGHHHRVIELVLVQRHRAVPAMRVEDVEIGAQAIGPRGDTPVFTNAGCLILIKLLITVACNTISYCTRPVRLWQLRPYLSLSRIDPGLQREFTTLNPQCITRTMRRQLDRQRQIGAQSNRSATEDFSPIQQYTYRQCR